MTDIDTHEVFNQPAPLSGYNLFETNRPLRDALKFNSPQLELAPLQHLGAAIGTEEMQAHARRAHAELDAWTLRKAELRAQAVA